MGYERKWGDSQPAGGKTDWHVVITALITAASIVAFVIWGIKFWGAA